MLCPIVIRGDGSQYFLHAYYPPQLMAKEAEIIVSGHPGSSIVVRDDNGITISSLTLLPKKMPDGEYRFSEKMLRDWAIEYCRVRDNDAT